jgi:transposase
MCSIASGSSNCTLTDSCGARFDLRLKSACSESYLRQREMLVQYRSHHIQHMQKALDQMNLKLHKVVSHISGVTGMVHRPSHSRRRTRFATTSALRNARCRKSEFEIAQALHGPWHEEHLFALRQAVELFDDYSQKIADCGARLEATFGALEDRSKGTEPPKPLRRPGTNTSAPDFDAHGLLYRATGFDLTRLDGIAETTALTLVAEVGLDVTAWRSEKHFASWLGLCPGSKVSGGKRLSGRTKPCADRAATALRVAAQSLYHSHSALGAYYRRLSARLGAAKAITATAHKLARLVECGEHPREPEGRHKRANRTV